MGACGSCICLAGCVDPALQKDIRGVLQETRSLVKDTHEYARQKRPQIEARRGGARVRRGPALNS